MWVLLFTSIVFRDTLFVETALWDGICPLPPGLPAAA